MFKRKSNNRKESLRYPDAKEVRVSVIFTRLGEIDTINERFSCEATLLISWNEGIDMLKQVEDGVDDTYYWDSQSFWDPQLYIDSKNDHLIIKIGSNLICLFRLIKMLLVKSKKRT